MRNTASDPGLKVVVSEQADRGLSKMDASIREKFLAHFEKARNLPPRKHLRHGLPYFVEKVTHQARFTYDLKEDELLITRCFSTHKEYERWLQSLR